MERRDWLLLYIAAPHLQQIPQAIDPIRIMKGLFLFAKEGGIPPSESYEFEPYHYGPCSFDIYRDLDHLVAQGLLTQERVPGRSWTIYAPTKKGRDLAQTLTLAANAGQVQAIQRLRELVLSLPFIQLLRYVYSRYPAYADQSVVAVGNLL